MKRNPLHVFFFTAMAGLLLTGAGCQSTGGPGLDTAQQKIMASCVAADAALVALAAANDAGKLSEEQEGVVWAAGQKIAIICMADEPPTLDSVRQAAFDEAIRTLTSMKSKAETP